jgi:hypothetical protein
VGFHEQVAEKLGEVPVVRVFKQFANLLLSAKKVIFPAESVVTVIVTAIPL